MMAGQGVIRNLQPQHPAIARVGSVNAKLVGGLREEPFACRWFVVEQLVTGKFRHALCLELG